ncbi:hypothetical protein [Ralstonia solanacearum]|uniref:hypothetical protein n=1 Tax=Ralstonia solanacearum TaxID=305 RepID=UPI0011122671|nr:hypothetical protein [Ralstonia solanacearum]
MGVAAQQAWRQESKPPRLGSPLRFFPGTLGVLGVEYSRDGPTSALPASRTGYEGAIDGITLGTPHMTDAGRQGISIMRKSIRSLARWVISVFNPPYQLTLSDRFIDEKNGQVIYIFKQYGLHEYVRVTYADIAGNDDLLKAINPVNLMDIHLDEHERRVLSREIKVKEILRGGKYRLSNGEFSQEYSGEYIVNNVDMFAHMSPSDLCRIALTTGFSRGRSVSKEINETLAALKEEEEAEALAEALRHAPRANVFELRRSGK